MNEKPKSFWKKPLTGLRKVLAWLALFAVVNFVMTYLIVFAAATPLPVSVMLVIGTVIAIFCVVVILFIRWLCSWRNFRRFLFGVACLVTVIALFYAEENWRGKHAWKKFKAEWEANGEILDFVGIIPPPVPDDQNFATTPIIATAYAMWFDTNGNRHPYATNFVNQLQIPTELGILNFTDRMRGWPQGEKTDLKAWQEYYQRLAALTNYFPHASQPQKPVEDILLALSKYDATIEKLRVASKLPYARFPLGYTDDNPAGILLPHLAPLKVCTITLQLRAIAELQSDQTEKALDDIKLMLRLTESVRTEPFLISHLVRIALWQIALQPIWESLADHKWTDAQLAALDAELGKLDFLADYQLSIRGERAGGVGIIDFLRRNRNQLAHIADETDFQMTMFRLAPGGWFEQNKISTCRMHNEYFLPVINLEKRAFSFTVETQASEALDTLVNRHNAYEWFSRQLLPAMHKASRKFVQAQSFTDMARIAIALERYRLAHGNIPETLDALTPQFMEKIPHDIIGGKPLKYHRTGPPSTLRSAATEDGSPGSTGAASQFVLYSVGWNETDDGGTIALTKGGSVDFNQGDWVWRYPDK